jgi:hypothetical protein
MLLLLLNAAVFGGPVPGGGGRANGLGGPVAPALMSALAEGDGGGSTTPGGPESELPLAGVVALLAVEFWGDESAVALPPSEFSLGICTVKRGRCALFVRGG